MTDWKMVWFKAGWVAGHIGPMLTVPAAAWLVYGLTGSVRTAAISAGIWYLWAGSLLHMVATAMTRRLEEHLDATDDPELRGMIAEVLDESGPYPLWEFALIWPWPLIRQMWAFLRTTR